MAGRPSKLTPELQGRFLRLLRLGCYRSQVAKSCGISPSTVRNWLKWGREDPASAYGEFLRGVLEAEVEAKTACLGAIFKAVRRGQWRAAAWWLERKYPAQWGRRTQLALGGPLLGEEDDGDRDPRLGDERAQLGLDELLLALGASDRAEAAEKPQAGPSLGALGRSLALVAGPEERTQAGR